MMVLNKVTSVFKAGVVVSNQSLISAGSEVKMTSDEVETMEQVTVVFFI